jgi:superfamily II DNA or RNA helicase
MAVEAEVDAARTPFSTDTIRAASFLILGQIMDGERVPWPHQEFGFKTIVSKVRAGVRKIVLTSPTGGGKTDVMLRLCRWAEKELGPVALYTPRKSLINQLIGNFREACIPFGVRSADFPDECRLDERIQISSPQTEDARCFKKVRWNLHQAKFVLVDEIHMLKGSGVLQKIIDYHTDNGSAVVMVTATPVALSKMADELVIAGTNSECRACGAIVPAQVWCCDELDRHKIERIRTSVEFTAGQVKSIWTTAIFGRVIHHWKRLNPSREPSLLFAPDVPASIWFAEEFGRAGYRWAHIDGTDCWLDGQTYKSSPEMRKKIIDMSRNHEIDGICNRFVMREGLDLPWLQHLILACVIGSFQSYIQTVGRVLRSHPGINVVDIQDHGGHWWGMPDPNSDIDWQTYWKAPEHAAPNLREERIRSGKEPQPIRCPKCSAFRTHGDTCPKCGYRHTRTSRMVIQSDGQLRLMEGNIYIPRRVREFPNTQKLWDSYYWRAKKSRNHMTFNQAEALFFIEQHYYPPRTLTNMPQEDPDWFSKVCEVSPKFLIQPPPPEIVVPQADFDMSTIF